MKTEFLLEKQGKSVVLSARSYSLNVIWSFSACCHVSLKFMIQVVCSGKEGRVVVHLKTATVNFVDVNNILHFVQF